MQVSSGPTSAGRSSPRRRNRPAMWPVAYHLAFMALFAFVFVVLSAPHRPSRIAAGDSQEYLYLAQTLAHEGVYAYSPKDAQPGGLAPREPFYPALLAGLMQFDTELYNAPKHCFEALGVGCEDAIMNISKLNLVLFGISALAIAGAVFALGGPSWAAWLAGGYMLLNFQAASDIGWVMSDYLALALASGFALATALAIRSSSPLA